jgi:hypothetical protein
MARGFDSKSVSDQQEEAERRRERKGINPQRESPRRRELELARVDVARRLESAPEPHRQMLQRALDAIDKELKETE